MSATRALLGLVALALLLAITLGTTLAVAGFAGTGLRLGPADWAALRFTLLQALVSAVISVTLAIPTARALARRRFFGRSAMVALMGAPFILPAIVAVLGLLSIWGRSGLASQALGLVGLPPLSIYGFGGVVMAHVFFNLPLATRLILQGWTMIPTEHFRLAANLGMTTRDVRRILEWPMLRAVVPGTFLIIFLLCLTSFAVVLALGGGPRATTLELAIYQALRFDFDLPRAATLALVQVSLCLAAATAILAAAKPASFSVGLDVAPRRWDGAEPLARLSDAVLLPLVALFLLLPLAAVVMRGVQPLLGGIPGLGTALVTTLMIALPTAVLSTMLALALAAFLLRLSRRQARAVEATSTLALAISPFVIGTGLFIILNPLIDPFSMAIPVTITVNATMALPFTLRILLPAFDRADRHYTRLGTSLGMGGWTLFRIALWPRLKRPAGFAAGLAAALAVGDLGVITLFAPPDLATLPLLMYRLMAAYQMAAAAGVALALVATAFALFFLFDRGGRLDHHVR